VQLLTSREIPGRPPDGPLLSLLRKLGDGSGHVLAIPQMVLDEYLGFHEQQAREAIVALQKAARQLSRKSLPSSDLDSHPASAFRFHHGKAFPFGPGPAEPPPAARRGADLLRCHLGVQPLKSRGRNARSSSG
jgi:hypothetical protein